MVRELPRGGATVETLRVVGAWINAIGAGRTNNYVRHGIRDRARPNGIDIEVSRHRTVTISNFQCIEVSTDDWMVRF